MPPDQGGYSADRHHGRKSLVDIDTEDLRSIEP
jgi:hypothetical protein